MYVHVMCPLKLCVAAQSKTLTSYLLVHIFSPDFVLCLVTELFLQILATTPFSVLYHFLSVPKSDIVSKFDYIRQDNGILWKNQFHRSMPVSTKPLVLLYGNGNSLHA